jgi:hypothetical protein
MIIYNVMVCILNKIIYNTAQYAYMSIEYESTGISIDMQLLIIFPVKLCLHDCHGFISESNILYNAKSIYQYLQVDPNLN